MTNSCIERPYLNSACANYLMLYTFSKQIATFTTLANCDFFQFKPEKLNMYLNR